MYKYYQLNFNYTNWYVYKYDKKNLNLTLINIILPFNC